MWMKRIGIPALTTCLILVLAGALLVSCASPAPTTTAPPAPAKPSTTTAPPTAAAPKTTAPPTTTAPAVTAKPAAPTAAPAKHDPVKVHILAGSFGSDAYIMGFATADIINKAKHPWLTAAASETLGSIDKLRMMATMDAKERRSTIAFLADSAYFDALFGGKESPRKFTELRCLMRLGGDHHCWVSWNPLSSPKDLIGKTIALTEKTSGQVGRWNRIIETWGIAGKATMRYVGNTAAADAFRDHLVDVMLGMFNLQETAQGPKMIPFDYWAPIYEQYKDKLYFLGVTADDVKQTVERDKMPLPDIGVPAKNLGPTQLQAMRLLSAIVGVGFVWEDFPEDVAYEFVKVLSANMDQFKYYLPWAPPTKEMLGLMPVLSLPEVTPGALKYYQENKISIGIEGMTKK